MTDATDAIDDIHDFWFGDIEADGLPSAEQGQLWFIKKPETDRLITARYAELLAQAAAGELDHWAETDRGLIALVIVLDQFSRNIHRDSPAAFAADHRALALALGAINAGRDRAMPLIHRVFLYLPLEHAEDLALQERCVELFEALVAENDSERVRDFASYAHSHRDVIARFGRFPHRNKLLGRPTTAEEEAYLDEHGGF
ncbi:MAG: DUF924 domain-containing protein [Halioglobus sp.]|nr:DUF924 domain-containing protein [Halioglobus sp.]